MKRNIIVSAVLLILASLSLSGCIYPYWGWGWHGHHGGHGGHFDDGGGRGHGGGHGGGRR